MDIAQIIAKKINGSLSKKEQELLDLWLEESKENEALYDRLKNFGNGKEISAIADLDYKSHWQKILRRSTNGHRNSIQRGVLFKYAAVIVCILGIGYAYIQFNKSNHIPIESIDAITLRLENGEVRTISSENLQFIVDSQGKVLGQQKINRLDYTRNTKTEKLIYNTLSVPHGRTYSVILSDSTIVHLNAGSSLKYPVQFIRGKERQIFLTGEGYFDVAKDLEHPFIVRSGNMDIRVLGTKFNVTAYPEDSDINTVLVEGSVSLYTAKSGFDPKKANILEPGYKAAWDRNQEKIEYELVDTDIYTGWIDGKLVIKAMSFKNIIHRLERHYRVTIDNKFEALNNEVFTATFDLESIDEALRIFSEETPFEYEVNSDHITIRKPNMK